MIPRWLPAAFARFFAAAAGLIIIVLGTAGCSATKDLGPRGDARLYLDRTWIMDYPRLEFTPVPLDDRRSYTLKAINLEIWGYQNFHLAVRGQTTRTAPLPANTRPPVIRIRVLDGKGRAIITETVGAKGNPWQKGPGKRRGPVLKSSVSVASRTDVMHSTPDTWTSFTVIVEIIEPAPGPGQFLHISAP